jgi:hypothetical protein
MSRPKLEVADIRHILALSERRDGRFWWRQFWRFHHDLGCWWVSFLWWRRLVEPGQFGHA